MKKRHLLLGLLLVSGIIGLTSCDFFGPAEEYTVSFETNGGSTVENITVTDGEYTAPSNPTKAGHTFAGWYADASFSTPVDINSLTVSADITLYAKWTINTYTVTFVSNGGSAVANATVEYNKPVTLPAAPTKDNYEFAGWFTDEALTNQYTGANIVADTTLYAKWTENTVYIVTFNTMGGEEMDPQYVTEDEYGFFTVQRPADPTCNYKRFVNWYADEACTTLFDFGNPISSNVTIYAKWDADYEWVTTDAGFDAGAAAYPGKAKPTEAVTFGRFTYGAGVYFEEATSSKTACVNNQQKDITFELTGRTNKIDFNIKYGSSGSSGTVTLYKIVDGAKVEIDSWNETGQNDYSVENLEAGTYVFGSVGSYRFYSLQISEELQKSAPNGIEIATLPQTNFLEGREFTSSNLAVYLTYENGRKDLVSDFDVDSSAYSTAPGNYTISVSYGFTDEYATYNFDTAYEVSVYDAVSISYGDHVLNSSRVTLPLEQVFLTGSEFTTKNLAIKAKGLKVGTDNEYVEFVLNADEYSLSAVDTSVKGSQTVTITAFETLTNSYVINVVDKVLDEESTSANIVVDAAAEVVVSNESIVFNRINDALRYLELCKVADNAVKTITVKAGSYYEKVEVKLPNVRLIGENDGTKETVVWYDRINGMNDPSGSTSYSTDGSASVSIRSSAVGFYAQDITFKNYYNTHELYLESLKISSDSQAVAVLVQADQSVFKNVKFTSYHDTLYAQIGRQYYVDCYIEGRTDYIFGYNATAYFENCDIYSIGAGVTEKNGGYVVATKGYSSGAGQDDVLYGYVFNNCNFDGDENVQDGSVSIARGWAEGMAIMVMNSTISAKFSKEYYGDNASPLNDRYGKMNAAPTPALLLEYNNTGAGAITADDQVLVDDKGTEDTSDDEYVSLITKLAEATCTVVTDADVAAPYEQLIKVFAADNKNVHWTSDWAGLNEKDATVYVKNLDGELLATYYHYQGGKLSGANLSEIKKLIEVPANYAFGMFTSDAEGENKYVATELAAENTIYVVFEQMGEFEEKTYEFSLEELVASYPETPADKTNIEASNLTGANSFLSLVGEPSNKCVVRAGNNCIEIKDAQLQVTFQGTGTLTVSFASTGGSNTSYFAVYKDGVAIAGTTDAAEVEGTPNVYQVTGTSYVTVTYKITEAGTYQISCPSTPGRGGRVNSIVMVDSVPVAPETVTDNYSFSLDELVASYPETPADKTNIEASNLTGANSFLSLVGEPSNKCVVRAGNDCIEIKDAQLQVTFQGTGTLTVSFASTGGSNTSYFAVYKDGVAIAGTTDAAEVDGTPNVYQVTGTSYVTVTYTITEAGTYQISCPSTPGRGGRVNSIVMADTYAVKVENPAHFDEQITYSFVLGTSDGSYIAPSDTVLLYDAANPFKDLAIEGSPRDNGGNSCQMTNCTLTFKVKKGSSVTINGYPNYTKYIINGRQVTETTYTTYFAETTEVTIVDNGGGYIKNIVVNPDGVGEVATVDKVEVVGAPKADIKVGTELDLSGLQLKVVYSDKSFEIITEGITTDAATSVKIDEAGTYTVTATAGEYEVTFTIVYVADVEPAIVETTSFTFKGGSYNGANLVNVNNDASYKVQNTNEVTLAKLTFAGAQSNGNDNWLKINAGATIKFSHKELATLNMCFYQGGANVTVTLNGVAVELTSADAASDTAVYTCELAEAGEVVITSTADNTYIGFLQVVVKEAVTETTSYTFKGGSYNGANLVNVNNDASYKVQNTNEVSLAKLTFAGAQSNGNDNWLKINAGATIKFNVVGESTLNMCFYQGGANVTVTVNGVAVELTSADAASDTAVYTCALTAGEVVITSTADNTYVGFLQVVYA